MDEHLPGRPAAPEPVRPPSAIPRAITGWIRAGTIDSELAGLTSILIEHGLPLVVAAPNGPGAAGWSGAEVRAAVGRTLLACALAVQSTTRTPEPTTVDAESLEEVLVRMPLLSLESVDESGARVAIVLVLEGGSSAWRVGAAHLLRPPLRDGHGHVQRQGPAVLATWDRDRQRFEHFSWGVMAELALLVDERAGDLEAAIDARTELLAGLVDHGIDDPGVVRLAVEAALGNPATAAHRH